jgi:hypothetical protein
MKSPRMKRKPPAPPPAKSASRPRPKHPVVTESPRDRLFEALREELGL